MSLNLKSRATDSTRVPVFLSSYKVADRVVLDLPKEKRFSAISVEASWVGNKDQQAYEKCQLVGWIASAGFEEIHLATVVDGRNQKPPSEANHLVTADF